MLIAVLAVSALLALVSAVLFQVPGLLGRDKVLTDFDAFHIAGTMAAQGRAEATYRATDMLAAQQAITGGQLLFPWTYPPPYMLFVAGLAQLPIGLAYLLFVSASLLFYLTVLRRIAGDHLPGTLIAVLPAVLLTVRTGQNGFLTAGLIGAFLLAFPARRAGAGLPLGLMCIKPHLAAGIGLLALFGRRWNAMAVAAGVVAAAASTATLAFGPGVWPAFLGGVREAGDFLAAGYYQLFRMTSVYACARSLGASASLAMVLHGLAALVAIGLFLRLWHRGDEPRILAAAACAVSLFVSPYNYDYDLTILGLAIGFVLPAIVMRARAGELALLLLLAWFVTGYGFAMASLGEGGAGGPQPAEWPSLTAPALALLIAAAAAILRRPAPPAT
ncbi:glycosyltransferase family 87 protein [Novosphingobium sp. JCM 18896]|uniref:glycosyltransferase family 87 protein n=1 Tax=Novosphingobium sp. JCM 18896 TaxID=2989731 RepID=UPI00222142A4|nr:glycosyltransferase family 87 protein [Novosphingobium sp. JCM 18896]MCW1429717.1 DUF2029 domain-containing protein [Novosphingobium sp. JCM 18896]